MLDYNLLLRTRKDFSFHSFAKKIAPCASKSLQRRQPDVLLQREFPGRLVRFTLWLFLTVRLFTILYSIPGAFFLRKKALPSRVIERGSNVSTAVASSATVRKGYHQKVKGSSNGLSARFSGFAGLDY
jgi:hypothetical protein